MTYSKKSWEEKLNHEQEVKIEDIPEKWAKNIGHGKMVILTPMIIDSFIKKIPQGRVTTINLIRNHFAREYNVDMTCPITTGIFSWIAAWASEERKENDSKDITPWWRVLKEGGKLNPKYPGGVKHHASYLEKEGQLIMKGKYDNSWKVKDYEKHLMDIK